MAITLNDTDISAHTKKRGGYDFTMAAGKTLKIETVPLGEEILSVEVPAGKAWAVSVIVNIVETDA